MSDRLRAYLVLAYGAVTMVLCFLASLPAMALTGTADFSIWLARRVWSPSALWLGGIRVEVTSLASLPEGPAVYASNHESAVDIWALFCAIPRNVRFVVKSELFRIPIFGLYLNVARYVRVDRGDHARAVAALQRAGEIVRSGTSLIVFPEGTRSPDARIQPFKKGPFVLAMEAGAPVVPVAIAGAAALNPKRRLSLRPGVIRIAIGPPVLPRDFPDKDALLREVRRRIIQQHVALGGLGGDVDQAIAARGHEGIAS